MMLTSLNKKSPTSTKNLHGSTTLPSLSKGLRPNTHSGFDLMYSTKAYMAKAYAATPTGKRTVISYSDYDGQRTELNAAENMTSTSCIQNAQVRRNRDLMMECRDNINKYKKDMVKLENDWNNDMGMTVATIELRMRELTTKMKIESTYAEKEHKFLHENANGLTGEMDDLAKEVAKTEERMKRLEAFCGVAAKVFQTNVTGIIRDEEENEQEKTHQDEDDD